MKVALNLNPTITGHSVRGIGTYTQNLMNEYKKEESKKIQFEFFKDPISPPPVDLIHYPYFDLFFHTLPINTKISRVVTIHDVIPLVFPSHYPRGIKGNINFTLQRLALRKVDAIICDSNTSKEDIISNLSVPGNIVHVVYLAPGKKFRKIDNNRNTKIVKKYRLPSRFALYVGDVNWSKNIPNMISAIKKSQANLVIVGKALLDDNLYETRQINKLIKKLDLDRQIFKIGYVDEEDLIEIYNLAFVTLLPSYYEGFGLTVLESMACGTPVICSNVSSLSEIGKGMAIFCKPESADDIAQKIMSVPQKGSVGKKLIAHSRKFTWSNTAENTIKVYEKILESNKQ